ESVACTSDGAFGYCMGGLDGVNSVPTNQLNKYDPVNNTWTALAPIPTAFYGGAAVYAPNTNRIYVFGGVDSNNTVLATVQIYDVASDNWLPNGAPMPDPAGRFLLRRSIIPAMAGSMSLAGLMPPSTNRPTPGRTIRSTTRGTRRLRRFPCPWGAPATALSAISCISRATGTAVRDRRTIISTTLSTTAGGLGRLCRCPFIGRP